MSNEWKTVDQALAYLARADRIPHRAEGEAALLDTLRSLGVDPEVSAAI